MNLPIQNRLEALLDSYERGELSFDRFSQDFSDAYIDNADELPEDSTTRLYEAIHEQLEWTTDSPPASDRAWGWKDPTEFREWLVSVRRMT